VLFDQVGQGIRDALRFSDRAVFVLGFGDVLGRDLDQSFSALDPVLEVRDSQDRLLKRDDTLCALGSLANVTLCGREDGIAFGIGGEDASGEGATSSRFLVLLMLCCISKVLVVYWDVYDRATLDISLSPTGR